VLNDEEKEVYAIKTTYKKLENSCRGDFSELFKTLRQIKTFPFALHLAWRVLLHRLPTKENLLMRGLDIENSLCVICGMQRESGHHLFLTCKITVLVWSRPLKVSTIQHNELRSNFMQCSNSDFDENKNRVWRGIWTIVI